MSVRITELTSRQRWRAALTSQPVDRLPFWPKLDRAYPRAQAAPFCQQSLEQLHAFIGSDQHPGLGGAVRELRSATRLEVVREANLQRTLFHTPRGTLERVCQWDEPSQSFHPIEFPVKTAADLPAMIAWYNDARYELDGAALARAVERQREVGEHGATHISTGQSPLMHWVEWEAGIERAHLLLADHESEVCELFEAMQRALLERARLLARHHPCDLCYLVENTSTTLISPAQYRRYNLAHVQAAAEVFVGEGKPLVLHMCGHLKELLGDLATIPVHGFEAFTAPTLGNTTLLDGRTACPDKCLIGGTQAMLWLEPAETILAEIHRRLDELPHHRGLVVTSAGVMPPGCRPEVIRDVCHGLREYPVRNWATP